MAVLGVRERKEGQKACMEDTVIYRGVPWGAGSWGPQTRAEEGRRGPVTGRGDSGVAPWEGKWYN